MTLIPSRAELRVHPLDDSEQAWLSTVLADAADRGLLGGICALSRHFDRERTRFTAEPRPKRVPSSVINPVAASLGEALRGALGMRWVVVTTATAVEIGLVCEEENVVVYPFAAVERCLTRDLDVSIEDYFLTIAARVRQIRAFRRAA